MQPFISSYRTVSVARFIRLLLRSVVCSYICFGSALCMSLQSFHELMSITDRYANVYKHNRSGCPGPGASYD